MATRTLVDGSTDLTLTTSWSGGAVPITGDTAIIPRGSQHIDTFSLSAVRLERLEIAFSGKISTAAGAALAVNVDNSTSSEAIIAGRGITASFAAGTVTNKWENTKVRSPGSRINFTGGNFGDFVMEEGTAVLDATAQIETLRQHGGGLTLGAETTGLSDAKVLGGTVLIQRPGTYTLTGTAAATLDVTISGNIVINMESDACSLKHVNGDITGGELLKGRYVDALEEPATIDSVTVGPGMSLKTSTRATWTNVTYQGIDKSAVPGL